ncbi:MAG: hypothetical protein ACLFSW_00540 [Halobacteriales archaeon]
MDCPGCGEEIYEEELIDGACPLCGQVVENGDGYEGSINEIVEMFESAEAVAMNVENESVERSFVLHASPSLSDRLKPKKCGACGRWHLKFGDKEYQVETDGYEGSLEVRYLCCLCA